MKILTVIGARPQFIKASVVSRAISAQGGVSEFLVHTGQHFDSNMSDVFFNQLAIPRPDVQLDINGGTHGQMTGRMLEALESVVLQEMPDRVLVYGDTNSTVAGALAAAKLHIPVAHVEAGLRSFNMKMPEEVNRIITDQLSDFLFCPTDTAVENLNQEGFSNKPVSVMQVGDVMQDAARLFSGYAQPVSGTDILEGFVLVTLHRAENTDDPERMAEIITALNFIHNNIAPVALPLHPRTKKIVTELGLKLDVKVLDPIGYFEMLWMLKNCCLVITDSGGLQKEAFFFGKACITMRDQTEWVELLHCGANVLTGADSEAIIGEAINNKGRSIEDPDSLYGGGFSAERIVNSLISTVE